MADSERTTEEKSARRILSTFREIGARVGQSFPTEQVRLAFLTDHMFQASDFEDGAKYALQQGWIGFVAGTNVKLLSPGQHALDSRQETKAE